jgi:hypothetical protein
MSTAADGSRCAVAADAKLPSLALVALVGTMLGALLGMLVPRRRSGGPPADAPPSGVRRDSVWAPHVGELPLERALAAADDLCSGCLRDRASGPERAAAPLLDGLGSASDDPPLIVRNL